MRRVQVRFIAQSDGKEIQNSLYRVDDSITPNQLDSYGRNVDHLIPQIYELKGDDIRFCYVNFTGKTPTKRPESFDPKNNVIIYAKRAPK